MVLILPRSWKRNYNLSFNGLFRQTKNYLREILDRKGDLKGVTYNRNPPQGLSDIRR